MARSTNGIELFGEAIDALYKASLNPQGTDWQQFAEAVRRWLNVEHTSVVMMDPALPEYRVAESTAMSDNDFDDYLAKIHSDNVWIEGIESHPSGRVYKSDDIYPNEKLVETRFYDEFLKDKQYFHAAGGYFHHQGDSQGVITIYQTLQQGCLSFDQSRKLQLLFPHLKRAYEINQTLFRARRTSSHLAQSLSQLGKGLVLLDDGGQIIEMNAIAEQLRTDHAFSVRQNRFVLKDSSAQARLSATINMSSPLHQSPQIICAQRCSRLPPLVITVIQSHNTMLPFAFVQVPKILLLLQDPMRDKRHSPELLQYLWGLTTAEARLAIYLADGLTLRECSETFQRTYETVRGQLKCIFYKSNSHSQNELISLINALT